MKQLVILLFTLVIAHVSHAQITISANTTEGCTPLPVSIQVTAPAAGTITSYLWEITFPDNSVITVPSSSYTANLSQPGSYDITLTINGNETQTWEDYITVHDIPIADFSVDLNTGCFPLCVEFTDNSTATDGAIVNWSWDFANGNTGAGNVITECYANTGVYSPFLSITDEFGCFSDITMPGLISVSDQFPTSTFTPSSLLDCNSPVGIDFANSSTGFSDLTSNWDFGDGDSNSSVGVLDENHVFNAVGTYDVCLEVVDEIGCTNTSCQEVIIFDTADSEFSVSDLVICQGQSISFQNETEETPNEYQWDFDGDGTIDSTVENPSFTYPLEGNFSPELTVYYSANCQDTQVFNEIEVLEQLLVDFEADNVAACTVPLDVSFTNLTTGGGTLTYEWTINNVVEGTDENLDFTFTDFGSYTISLVVSNDVGCVVAETKINYIVIAYPVVTFSTPESLCSDEEFIVSNINISSVDPITDWQWDFDGDGTVDSTEEQPEYTYTEAGDFVISLDFVTENGCVPEFVVEHEITISDPIEVEISMSDTLTCAENVVTFCIIDMDEDMNGVWNFGDDGGNVAVSYVDSCTEYHYQDTGMFDIALSVALDGCTNNILLPDAIYILGPIARFDPVFSCNDQLSVTFADNSIQAEELIWDFGDGSGLVYDELTPTHTFPGNGTYTISLTAINDSIGCQDVTEIDIVISDPDPSLLFSQTSGCPPLIVEISSVETNPYWFADFGNGTTCEATLNENQTGYDIIFVQNGITQMMFINGATSNFWPDITYTDVGVYDVFVTITDENGCESEILYEDLIEVNSSPTFASFTMDIIESCDSVYLNFTPDVADLDDIIWSFNNGTSSTNLSPNVLYESPYPDSIGVTLSAADDLGCTSSVSQNFGLDFPTSPLFTILNNPNCIGDEMTVNNISQGDIISYSWDFGDPNSGDNNSSTDENPVHAFSENGSFTICLTTENNFGCFTTYCIENAVTINNPTADFTFVENVTNCNYGISFVNTTAGVVNCSDWEFGDDQSGVGATAFHTYSIGIYDVSLIVCNEFGCIDTLIQEDILNFGNVVGPFTMALDDAPCAPFTVDFEAFNIDDNTFDYFWDFADGFGDPGGNTVTSHDYLTPGTYCPTLIMTDPNGCSALIECEEPFTVEEFTVNLSNDYDVCTGDSILFTITGGETNTWTDMTFVEEIDENNFWVFPNTTTEFTINSTLSDCETTNIFTITVFELPLVTYSIQEEICHQEDVFNLTGGLPDDVPGVYTVNSVIESAFDPSWTPDFNYEIVYEYTDANGCSNTAQDDIYIHALPAIILEPFDNVCQQDDLIILGGESPLGGQFINEANEVIIDLLPIDNLGFNNITYEFTDANGCYNSATDDILVSPNPQIDLSTGPACAEENLEIFNNSSIASGTITETVWELDEVFLSNDFDMASIETNIAGDFTLGLTLTSIYGCISEEDLDFHVNIKPVANFDFEDVCQAVEVVFSNTSTSEEGNINEYNWKINSIDVSSDENLVNTFENWGIYDIELNIVSETGCTNKFNDDIEIFPYTLVDFVVDNNCYEEISVFNNISVTPVTDPQTIVLSYFWEFGDSNTSDGINVVDNLYATPGTYEVTLHAVTNLDCQSQITKEIIVYPLPQIEMYTEELEVCQGSEITISSNVTVDTPSNISNLYWSVNGEATSQEPEFNYVLETASFLLVNLLAYSDDGCYASESDLSLVLVRPSPVAGFTFSPQGASVVDPLIEFEDLSVGATEWIYNFGDGHTSEVNSPEHEYEEYGVFNTVQIVSNDFGCTDTTEAIIRINPELSIYVPNAFTPNEDGVNDWFIPVFYGFDFSHYNFQVFDNWGVKIFETDDPNQGWNGNMHGGGHFVKDGVYNWKMEVRMIDDTEIHGRRGSVTVLR